MRPLFFLIFSGLLTTAACVFNAGDGIKGSGPIVSETRSLPAFEAVDIGLAAKVTYTVGDQPSVKINTQGNLLPVLKTEVDGNRLKVYFEDNVSYSKDVEIQLTGPALRSVDISGSAEFVFESAIRSPELRLEVSGSGEIRAREVQAEFLRCVVGGSGSIDLGGTASELRAQVGGSGDINAQGLNVQKADLDISGSGNIRVGEVSADLRASVSGSGDVRYRGRPSVRSEVSGSGSVSAE